MLNLYSSQLYTIIDQSCKAYVLYYGGLKFYSAKSDKLLIMEKLIASIVIW